MSARVLLTNDDGIGSPGIRRLAAALAPMVDLTVVAPQGDMSGSGTGIGPFDTARGVALERLDGTGFDAWTVGGPPGLAVLAGMLGAFGDPPDLVVSGINAGLNTGHSIIHSGTVGGALTARSFGIQGLAVSLAPSDPWHWDTAVEVAVSAVRWVLDRHDHLVLNVNVPARPLGEVRGAHWSDLDEFGHIRVAMANEPEGRLEFGTRDHDTGFAPGCDTDLVWDGYVTLTPLSAIEPTAFPAEPASDVWSPETRRPG